MQVFCAIRAVVSLIEMIVFEHCYFTNLTYSWPSSCSSALDSPWQIIGRAQYQEWILPTSSQWSLILHRLRANLQSHSRSHVMHADGSYVKCTSQPRRWITRICVVANHLHESILGSCRRGPWTVSFCASNVDWGTMKTLCINVIISRWGCSKLNRYLT